MKNKIMEVQKSCIDIVLVSDAKNKRLREITEHAIKSLGNKATHTIIIVESNKSVNYSEAITIHPNVPFNYNKYLNLGAQQGKSDYIFFGNNDLIFGVNWDDELIKSMKSYGVVSASPLCPRVAASSKIEAYSGCFYGYEIITRFCGWAFMWTREFYSKISGLDEGFTFWCSDNIAVEQLIANDQKHLLVTSSIVGHLTSSTLATLEIEVRRNYTTKEIEKFNKRFNRNLWDSPHLKRNF